MRDIKIKEKSNTLIKTLDKSLVLADKTKETLVVAKEKVNNLSNKENQAEYGSEKISQGTRQTARTTTKIAKKEIKKAPERIRKTAKRTKKVASKSIKTARKVTKTAVKTAEKTAKATKAAVKATVKATKVAIKATIAAIKALIASIKALVAAIAAGGWVAVIVIIVICLIGLICASVFGVFFSNETGSKSMTTVIRETNSEVYNKIEDIKKKNKYDEVDIESTYTNWNEVIAVYSVKYSEDGKYNITIIDEGNEKKIKNVFWDFNEIQSSTRTERISDDETKTILSIKIVSKSKEEIMNKYHFKEKDINQVNELLSKQYDSLWRNLIYGSLEGNHQIVEIAKQQVGNVGGEPYWRWYGFDHRIEWCAVFVSWAANKAGVLNDKIPKFAGVYTGIEWFKARGQWQNKGYLPRPGDIIFFDWEVDGKPNHVGIVEKTEEGYIYTIEGNSTDDGCRAKKYIINSKVIYGFGVPAY